MSKSFSLKPKEEKKLLEKAQPVVTIFSAISSLQKKIAEIKNKKVFKKNILKNSKYYQTLGLSLGSSAEKVQKAYKKLASKWHPDKPAPSGFTKEQQTEEFQKVNEAANFLLGQEKKRSNDKGSEKLNQQIVANERLIKSDGADESEVRDQNKEEVEKRKQASLEEIEKLQIKLQEKEKELQKLGEKKVNEGKKAIRFLLHYNQNLVKYIVNGYPSFGGRIDPDELTAEGISSLPKAIEKFDLKSKNRFATYAGF
jgi:DNA-directed RNA polymerase sigma subunit (sigma70/sigma32)